MAAYPTGLRYKERPVLPPALPPFSPLLQVLKVRLLPLDTLEGEHATLSFYIGRLRHQVRGNGSL